MIQIPYDKKHPFISIQIYLWAIVGAINFVDWLINYNEAYNEFLNLYNKLTFPIFFMLIGILIVLFLPVIFSIWYTQQMIVRFWISLRENISLTYHSQRYM